jgi:hypothetical protein
MVFATNIFSANGRPRRRPAPGGGGGLGGRRCTLVPKLGPLMHYLEMETCIGRPNFLSRGWKGKSIQMKQKCEENKNRAKTDILSQNMPQHSFQQSSEKVAASSFGQSKVTP